MSTNQPTTARTVAPPVAAPDSRAAALLALDAALDKKGLAPVLIDVSAESSYTDYILLISGRSDRHVQTIADAVEEAMARTYKRAPIGAEGKSDGRWVLIDFGELVVHVFYHPLREFYDLEGLWCDAPREPIQIPDDARIDPGHLY